MGHNMSHNSGSRSENHGLPPTPPPPLRRTDAPPQFRVLRSRIVPINEDPRLPARRREVQRAVEANHIHRSGIPLTAANIRQSIRRRGTSPALPSVSFFFVMFNKCQYLIKFSASSV